MKLLITYGVHGEDSYRPRDFVIIAMFAFTVIYWLHQWAQEGPVYEYKNVRIVQKYSDYRYLLAKSDGAFEAYFCTNYKPDLIPGCFLTALRYEDEGSCWSVQSADLGYWYKHDSQGDDVTEDGHICYSERTTNAR